MAKLIPFGYAPDGRLVYRNTGRTAPETYSVRGNTVYGANGRRVGTVGKGTAKQQRTMASAAKTRTAKAVKGYTAPNAITPMQRLKRIRRLGLGRRRPDAEPRSAAQVRSFGKGVRSMALLSAKDDPRVYEKIRRMEDSKLQQLYDENKLIFDTYFKYSDVHTVEGKGIYGGPETASNAWQLIRMYEERFGTIATQEVLW